MTERVLKIAAGSSNEVVRKLRESGVRVVHRTGDTVVIDATSTTDLSNEITHQLEEVDTQSITPEHVADLATVEDQDIASLALQLRQSAEFQHLLMHRENKDEDWGAIFNQY